MPLPRKGFGMNSLISLAEGCVCGAIRFNVSGDPRRVTVCHCHWCQRRTGSAFGIELVFDSGQIEMSGGSPTRYRHVSDESGHCLEIEFCGQCGGNLGFTLEAAPDIRTLPTSAFDDPSWITPERQISRHVFARSRRDWSDFSSEVEINEEHF